MPQARAGHHLFPPVLLLALLSPRGLHAADGAPSVPAPDSADVEFFESKVRPVLVENCYECHSAAAGDKLKAGLRLDSRDGLLKGGESGRPAVVPGDAEASPLVKAIRWSDPDFQMPPKKRLSDQQVADVVAWVNRGAPDPRTGSAAAPAGAPAVPVLELGKDHWAFKPPQDHPAPPVKDSAWAKTPIDRFVLAALEAKGLKPSPPADRRTLIRRAHYDLTGLPPTHEEVEAFAGDADPRAFEKLVDRLLASPHYGERWGRYWLDLARYADTKGYVYGDREDVNFVHSHVYRDWVIRSLNEDLPYDQFLLRQIAADQLLPAGKTAGIGEDAAGAANNASLAAMGFLTVGRRFLGVPHDIIDDRIDVLTRTTQGLSVACARCHDHKYDPIPTADYYSLYGVFAASTEKTVPVVTKAPEPRTAEYDAYEKGLNERVAKLNAGFEKFKGGLIERLRNKTADYLATVPEVQKQPEELFYVILEADDVNPVIARQWAAYLYRRGKAPFDPVWQPWTELSKLEKGAFEAQAPAVLARLAQDPTNRLNPHVAKALAERPPKTIGDLARAYGELLVKAHHDWTERLKSDANATALPDADQEALRQVLYGPDTPAAVPPASIADTSWFFDEKGKVELGKLQVEIDRWINSQPGAVPHALILEDRPPPLPNPRVFKRGNPATKGEEVPRRYLWIVQGDRREAYESGSGRLQVAKAIASADNPLTARVMVNRVWLGHFGAGLVDTPSDFGVRCDPPSHPELLDHLAVRFTSDLGWSLKKLHRLIMTSAAYQQSGAANPAARSVDPENRLLWRFNRQRLDFEAMRDSLLAVSGELDKTRGGRPTDMFGTRRSVYGKIDRQFLPSTFRAFDFANPDLHIPQRGATTVPQQALFFMNSGFVMTRAMALANRPDVTAAADPSKRVRRMYRLLFQREPTAGQLQAGLGFIEATSQAPQPTPAPIPIVTPWEYGFGEFDPVAKKLKSFTPLPVFTGKAWQGGPAYPDPQLGWAQLTASGGHPGNDLAHAAVRRWVAPRDMTVAIGGTVAHQFAEGNGIQAYIVHGRDGLLASWALHNQSAEAKIEPVAVKQGDTIDFVVDFRPDSLSHDDFLWAPVIRMTKLEGQPAEEWDAQKQFGGKTMPPPPPLTAWEQYAQVLLQSNEFMFVD